MHLTVAITTLLAAMAAGHAHHDHDAELAQRRDFFLHSRSNLNHCTSKMAEAGIEKRAAHRRAGLASDLAKRNGVRARNLDELVGVSHLSGEDYTADTDPAVIFSGNKSCVLNPQATEGPFYVAGEFIRQDIMDGEEGVPLAVDVQVIDTETCEPVSGAYLEVWHCNATGIYSGVVSVLNGAGHSDPGNINATFHRGIQPTDSDGAAQFTTTFPGHYIGRATHIHLILHAHAEERENGTLMDVSAAHVGQMYFDDDLISEVEEEEPYARNKQPLTVNADDLILAQEADGADPFMHYTKLGDTVADGLLAWLSVGVNASCEKTVSPAAMVYEDGGEVNEGSTFGDCVPEGLLALPEGTEHAGEPPDSPDWFPIPSACSESGGAGDGGNGNGDEKGAGGRKGDGGKKGSGDEKGKGDKKGGGGNRSGGDKEGDGSKAGNGGKA